jgi:hypothetical protein
MRSPVIYIFFNRPEVTRRTFAALREQHPARLYLIADGPRPNNPSDAIRCAETRALVEAMLDWDCEITRDYSAINLGCGRRIATGLTAAFALLGEAIVLEDDILPHPDFFNFCDDQLAAHRDDPHIHAICGFQPLGRYAPASGPVVPSTFNGIWGWASWQRAWAGYRFDIADTWKNAAIREGVRDYLHNDLNFLTHSRNFDELTENKVDTWDFQWSFALLACRRVMLFATVNLIENLGFGADATHTVHIEPYLAQLATAAVVPTSRRRDTTAPDCVHDKLFGEIIHTRSPFRLGLIRLLARCPRVAGLFFHA